MFDLIQFLDMIEGLGDNFSPEAVIDRLRDTHEPLTPNERHLIADVIEALADALD